MSDRSEPANSSHRATAVAVATLVALIFGLSPQNAPGTMQAVPPAVGSPTAAPAAATAEAVDQTRGNHGADARAAVRRAHTPRSDRQDLGPCAHQRPRALPVGSGHRCEQFGRDSDGRHGAGNHHRWIAARHAARCNGHCRRAHHQGRYADRGRPGRGLPAFCPSSRCLGGAEGVLGSEGLRNKRIFIDFRHDQISIAYSRDERPARGFLTVPFRLVHGQLIVVDCRSGECSPTRSSIRGGKPRSGTSRFATRCPFTTSGFAASLTRSSEPRWPWRLASSSIRQRLRWGPYKYTIMA